jgi:5-methylcytosine-specific restriction endonuclease McrA
MDENIRKNKWREAKGEAYAASQNEKTKLYQETFYGKMALRAGACNTGTRARGGIGKITGSALVNVWVRQNGFDGRHPVCCADCGEFSDDWEVDHILSLANGGTNTAENIQLLCHDCHKEKTKGDRKEQKAQTAQQTLGI